VLFNNNRVVAAATTLHTSAPTGPWNVATGCAPPALRPAAQPVESGTRIEKILFIFFSPRRGEGGVRTPGGVHRGVSRTSRVRFVRRRFRRPSGADESKTRPFHGLRSARLPRAELHPWLHSTAPFGAERQ